MTLYLNDSVTTATIAEAARAGIAGVKVYPAGVTTNSAGGVVDLEKYYPVFEAMQTHDLVLNLHGEVPSTPSSKFVDATNGSNVVTVLNAEPMFLPTLHKIHKAFPQLRIVLEHCTTRQALDAVRACGPTVAATITAHHLYMTVDDWCGDAFNFCKPVAKTPEDRVALVRAVVDHSGKFFFGSDSAPHPIEAKTVGKNSAAGCFTQPWATQLVVGAVEQAAEKGWVQDKVASDALRGFLSDYGRNFYRIQETKGRERILLEDKGERIMERLQSKDGRVQVVPFRSGEETCSLTWKS